MNTLLDKLVSYLEKNTECVISVCHLSVRIKIQDNEFEVYELGGVNWYSGTPMDFIKTSDWREYFPKLKEIGLRQEAKEKSERQQYWENLL